MDETALSRLGLGREELKPRATMRDVAALAGVGLKTVSRVVNGEPGVSDALVGRVRRAADQLDYLPNLAASNLRRSSGKTATIGLLLENVGNPFSSALHRAIEMVARGRGIEVFSGSVDEDPERERRLAATFAARRVDGLIIVPAGHDQSYLLNDRRAGIAMVFVDRPAALLDADSVVSDNRGGAETGTLHLLAQGHRRIAFLGDLATIHTAAERFAGYARAIETTGGRVDARLVRHDLRSIEAAEAATTELLWGEDRPTAIFASQNLVAVGAIRALRGAGLQRRVALVGFDDVLLADLLEPPVTVVAQDPTEMGALAARLLFARLDGEAGPSAHHVVPTRLIPRGSGEIAPEA
jgi:LacI family transcriptional regulator